MTNTLYTNDNLFILHGLNSNSVDLIYLDPPFNTKRVYSAPVGSKGSIVSFKDMWTWEDVNEAYLDTLAVKYPIIIKMINSAGIVHSKTMAAYLTYMVQRLIEMHRVLKDTGSIYFHCDSTASHYLKLILDMVFGHRNFVSDITWKRTTAKSHSKRLANNKDTIFFYHKDANNPNATYNQIYLPLNKNMVKTHYTQKNSEGRVYGLDNLKATMPGDGYTYVWNGVVGRWRCPIETMREHEKNGRLAYTKNGVARYIRYLDESQGVAIDNVWIDIKPVNSQAKERTGYPTQKPLALLNRIISASSNPGDVVLDPFCGCATTCVAAQQLGRKWIGIDIEKNAVTLLKDRLEGDAGMFKDFIATDKIPVRTDVLFESPDKKSIKERLYKEQNGKCNGCGVAFEIRNLAVDHIVPVHHGGGSYYENYQLLCGHCNSTKGERPMEYLMNKVAVRAAEIEKDVFFSDKAREEDSHEL